MFAPAVFCYLFCNVCVCVCVCRLLLVKDCLHTSCRYWFDPLIRTSKVGAAKFCFLEVVNKLVKMKTVVENVSLLARSFSPPPSLFFFFLNILFDNVHV